MLTLRRRALLRHAVLAGALVSLSGLAAACQQGAPAAAPAIAPSPAAPGAAKPAATAPAAGAATTAPAAPAAAAKDSPRRGGTLTWGLWDRTDDIDPATTSGAAALEVLTNILEPLITIDADLKIYPALAKAWSMEGGGERSTFTCATTSSSTTAHPWTLPPSSAPGSAFSIRRQKRPAT